MEVKRKRKLNITYDDLAKALGIRKEYLSQLIWLGKLPKPEGVEGLLAYAIELVKRHPPSDLSSGGRRRKVTSDVNSRSNKRDKK